MKNKIAFLGLALLAAIYIITRLIVCLWIITYGAIYGSFGFIGLMIWKSPGWICRLLRYVLFGS